MPSNNEPPFVFERKHLLNSFVGGRKAMQNLQKRPDMLELLANLEAYPKIKSGAKTLFRHLIFWDTP
jgi:hypothetical protein